MNFKKTAVSVIIAVCVVCGAISVSAAEPTYSVSEAYKSSKYYDNLKKVNLSGDMATDVIAIALSQLGYHEGDGNDELHGINTSGSKDFVEYNVLYGKLDNNQGNGLSYGYYWCASFVNWCLRQAEVSKDASAASEVSCHRWLSACKKAEIFHEKEGYIPKKGDLVFFNDGKAETSSSHIGIVMAHCDGLIKTVEGNTSNGSSFSNNGNYVAIKSYSLENDYIVGYASPDYERKKVVEVDYFGEILSSGLYISETKIDAYPSSDLSGDKTTVGIFEVFEVKKINGSVFEILYQKDGRALTLWADIRGKARQMTAEKEADSVSLGDGDASGEIKSSESYTSVEKSEMPDETPSEKPSETQGEAEASSESNTKAETSSDRSDKNVSGCKLSIGAVESLSVLLCAFWFKKKRKQ